MEWLKTEASSEDGEADDEDDDLAGATAPKPQALYLTMPSEESLRRLLAQWNRYRRGEGAQPGFSELWKLFGYLHAMRVWSIEDRLDPFVAAYVRSALAKSKDVVVEIDLWYRTEKERRDASLLKLQEMLDEVGGELLDTIDIPEIRYQGALARLPAATASKLAGGDGAVAKLDDIMTIRPQSTYASRIEATDTTPSLTRPSSGPTAQACVAALLDGYPIENHAAVAQLLKVVEVDVPGASVPAAHRFHGTAMASLVLNGDLGDGTQAQLQRPLVTIPVLTVSKDGSHETTPEGKLPIGVIYRALRTIVDAKPTDPSGLSNVVVINHSLCAEHSPFVRRPSPWATLLDHFGHAHRLLFVVSAGNIFSAFPVSTFPNLASFQAASAEDRQAALMAAVELSKGTRGLLSPAESVNSITVGALHEDAAPPTSAAGVDPFPTLGMTSLASAVGLGVNRSIKPDLIERGGRFTAAGMNTAAGLEVFARPSAHFGQLCAAPSPSGDLTRLIRTAGTSNATALITRASHAIVDAIEPIFDTGSTKWRELPTRAVVLKALLAHGCRWGEMGAALERVYPPQDPKQWSKRRDTVSRFIGYGHLDPSRVVSGDQGRITLIADASIRSGQMHAYRLPVPASMLNNKDIRTVTLTLAWTTPTTHTTTDHRAVALKICGPDGSNSFWKGIDRTDSIQPNVNTANRGTLIHVVLSGRKLMKDTSGQLAVCVQALSKDGHENTTVPYALAITLEIAQQQRSNLYAEVLQSVRARTRARLN